MDIAGTASSLLKLAIAIKGAFDQLKANDETAGDLALELLSSVSDLERLARSHGNLERLIKASFGEQVVKEHLEDLVALQSDLQLICARCENMIERGGWFSRLISSMWADDVAKQIEKVKWKVANKYQSFTAIVVSRGLFVALSSEDRTNKDNAQIKAALKRIEERQRAENEKPRVTSPPPFKNAHDGRGAPGKAKPTAHNQGSQQQSPGLPKQSEAEGSKQSWKKPVKNDSGGAFSAEPQQKHEVRGSLKDATKPQDGRNSHPQDSWKQKDVRQGPKQGENGKSWVPKDVKEDPGKHTLQRSKWKDAKAPPKRSMTRNSGESSKPKDVKEKANSRNSGEGSKPEERNNHPKTPHGRSEDRPKSRERRDTNKSSPGNSGPKRSRENQEMTTKASGKRSKSPSPIPSTSPNSPVEVNRPPKPSASPSISDFGPQIVYAPPSLSEPHFIPFPPSSSYDPFPSPYSNFLQLPYSPQSQIIYLPSSPNQPPQIIDIPSPSDRHWTRRSRSFVYISSSGSFPVGATPSSR